MPDSADATRQIQTLQAEVRTLKRRLAETEAAAAAAQAETERLRSAAERPTPPAKDSHSMAELDAARNRIEELETRLAATRDQLKQAREAVAAGAALPRESVSFDDAAEAEALLEGVRSISFGKILRTAVLAHVIVVLVTSLGFLYRGIRSARTEPAMEAAEAAPIQAAPPPPTADVSPFEDDPTPQPPRPQPQQREPDPPPDRPLTELERRVQELPDADEVPVSDVTLDF